MLLIEGGVGGHMSHLYDNPSLTFKKMKEVLIAAASGELIGTEKTDGQNLFVSYSIPEGRAKAARNGGHVKQGGLTPEEIAKFFGGRGDLEKTFSESFKAFEEAVEDLSDEEKEQIFGPDTNVYYSAEVIDPRSTNVINYYDTKTLAIHRAAAAEFDKETGNATDRDVSQNVDFLARALEAKQDELQAKDYKVEMDAIQGLAGLKDGSILANTLDRLEGVISAEGISDNQTVLEYMIARIMTLLVEKGIELDPETEKKVIKRILFSNKGYLNAAGYDKMPADINLNALLKSVPKEQRGFLRSIVDAKDAKEYLKQAIWPVEDVIHDFSVEMLRNLESLFVLDNGENISHKEVERLRAETAEAINAIENSGNEEALKILQVQMDKLKDVENVSTAAEGFVFDFDGHTYKFTGNFAPMNQLLGLFKYGRGNVPPLKKQIDKALQVPRTTGLPSKGRMKLRENSLLQEVMDILLTELSINDGGDIGGFQVPRAEETVALFPGAFRPPTKGHLATTQSLMSQADRTIVLISNPQSESSKRRVGTQEVTPEMTKKIWELYGIPPEDVQIAKAASPVRAVFDFIDDPKLSPPGTKILLGCSDKGGDEARWEGAAAYARKTRGDEIEVITGICPTKRHDDDYEELLNALEKVDLPSVGKGKDPMNIHGSDMRYLAAEALKGNKELEELFKHFFPKGVDHKEILRILSSSISETISEMVLKLVEETLNEVYVTRSCKKKDGSSGNCHVTFKDGHTACYDNCKTARAATHGGVSEGEELEEIHASTDELPSRKKEKITPGDIKAASDARMRASFQKAIDKQKEKDRLSLKFNKKALEEELEELRVGGGGGGASASSGPPVANCKQCCKQCTCPPKKGSSKSKKRNTFDPIEEISSGAGGAAGGYSLPLGMKPSYPDDSHPKLRGSIPGIKLIYKRNQK